MELIKLYVTVKAAVCSSADLKWRVGPEKVSGKDSTPMGNYKNE